MKIGTYTLDVPVMNAACSVAKTEVDAIALAAAHTGAVVIGSITVEPRTGNAEPRWYVDPGHMFALNSFGMPNEGEAWYREHLPAMIKAVHAHNKPLILSIAGFSVEDFSRLATLGAEFGVDMLELNLGCPNTAEAGRQNPIFSFDLEMIATAVDAAAAAAPHTAMSVKLSPYSNPAELARVAALLATKPVAAVVTSNTFPNGYWTDAQGQPVLASNGGLAGTSGAAMLPIGLGQVRQFRTALPEHIDVVGVGGISSPEHVAAYLHAGATAVQAASLIVENGHDALTRLTEGAL